MWRTPLAIAAAFVCVAGLLVVTGCASVTTPPSTHEIVLTLFNESHDVANIGVTDTDGRVVGVAAPPLVAGASHADVTLRVPNTGEWQLWINRGEPGAGVIISNADVIGCVGRVPIQIEVDHDRNLSWSGQPSC